VRDDRAAVDRYLRWAKPCIALAEKLGVTISIENEFNAFGWDPAGSDATRRPEALHRLLTLADSPRFRTTFDPANFICAGEEDALAAYRLLSPFIAYVHVKNVVRVSGGDADTPDANWRLYSDFGRFYRTCPLGEGLVPWRALLQALAQDGYDGVLTLEPHSQPHRRRAAWIEAAADVAALEDGAAYRRATRMR
jgi:sugar phosphate isomerase/epimerase